MTVQYSIPGRGLSGQKRGAVDEARRSEAPRGSGAEWGGVDAMLPALLHFALARHIREDAAALGTMFLLLGEAVVAQAVVRLVPQAVGSPSGGSLQLRGHRPLLLGGSVLRRRPATRTRMSKYRSSATQHFGCDAMRCAAAGS
jgi:hypothetical protein